MSIISFGKSGMEAAAGLCLAWLLYQIIALNQEKGKI